MPRNMRFTLTADSFLRQQKTITRRFGWAFLKPDDRVCGDKAMGLQPGESIGRLGLIQIVCCHRDPLNNITQDDDAQLEFQRSNQATIPLHSQRIPLSW
ncbi:MAG: hypothetical protein HOM14_03870 [Gammaproteobacteria bacterium]|jgi:hypothetical protein|nr:hypothetical protein [Gammaproteobacteria bacterium]MBT4194805.1 hypothetical protein [Gammaproteobacteria bacterium]MBT6550473.1 hypothetical protein [Gammaproteobacteria bacterium]